MDEDTTDAAYHQLELEAREREDRLIARLRKECSGFRSECDEFSAEFNRAVKAIRQEQSNVPKGE
jgi:hypothetical protein